MAILKVRDGSGNIVEVQVIKGEQGVRGPQGIPGKDNLPNVSTIGETEVTLTMDHNIEYRCANPVTTLTIEGFNSAEEGKVSMWAIQFTAGDGITVAMPETVKWAVADPVFATGVTYWLNFVPLVSGNVLGVWVSDE